MCSKKKNFFYKSDIFIHGPPKAYSEADLLQKAKNDQKFLDFVARTSCQKIVFFFLRKSDKSCRKDIDSF